MYMKKGTLGIVLAIAAILGAVAFLIFKLGQQSGSAASWSEYDDYGWS
ncbi:MAG: hypothetical protein HDT46_08575 [Ruminococcaceae bacterium]|nr:hypothetical protein [Oscillospiraceae bacterium]MBD5116165.1 hypothetical protein [Oscillospiraceae bacterium]